MAYCSLLNPKVSTIRSSYILLAILLILENSFNVDSRTIIQKIGICEFDLFEPLFKSKTDLTLAPQLPLTTDPRKEEAVAEIELAVKEVCVSIEFVKRNKFIGIASKFSQDTLKEFMIN